jgi:uncharacterized SAM-binding protein YcdF (DUF218 family)
MLSMHPSGSTSKKTATRARKTAILIGLAVAMGLFLSRAQWLPAIGAFLVMEDPLVPADLVIPLAGDLERISYAAQLYKDGYAGGMLLTNLPLATQVQRNEHLEQVRTLAISQGVKLKDIVVIPQAAQTTFGEAQHIRRTLELLPVKTILVVTSPWHTRRSRLVFNAVFDDSSTSIHILPVEGSSNRSLPEYVASWWRERNTVNATASEYFKLFAFMLGIR